MMPWEALMRFATLRNGGLAAVVQGMVVRIETGGSGPRTMMELVEAGDAAAAASWESALRAAERGAVEGELGEVRLAAPIPRPRRNILCVGKNYREHVNEVKATALGELPEHPIFFTKATTAVSGPADPVPAHTGVTEKLDYEGEVAIIVGCGGRDIEPESAWEHIFGYTAINDLSARDLQARHRQWFRGKSLDGTAPMGPTIVHRSTMPPLGELRVRTWVNGELRQQGNLGQLIFDIPTLLATLSRGMTLLPGDIIATGTPAGVGAGFDPPQFLKPGDKVVVEVIGAGRIVNRIAIS